MTVSNIGLASVLSDPFGKTASSIMNELLSSQTIDDDKILKLIHKKCKNKDKILDAIHGLNMTPDQEFKLKIAKKHMNQLDVYISACEVEMIKRAYPMRNTFEHIVQIKGIRPLVAVIIISEIGVDMTQFESDKQLVSWAGLAPANNESAGKKKSVRISKAVQYLKPLLVQCALASIRDKEGYYSKKHIKIKKRRGHKKAIIAIARMILITIYHMNLTGETFNPSDIDEILNPKQYNPNQQFTVESALYFLQRQGIDTSSIQINS
jgi:hypothetical protein